VDGATTPLYDRLARPSDSGASGTVSDVGGHRGGGAFARNVIGRRILARGEGWLLLEDSGVSRRSIRRLGSS